MISYFDLAAQHLLSTYTPDALGAEVLIVPTKRAVLYLQASLRAAVPAGVVMRAPRILTMEDFVAELADTVGGLEEDLALHLRLYDTLKKHLPNLEFDDFAGWGPLLLRDFSTIDKELGDPKQIFAYLSDAHAIERWQVELPTDEAASAAARYLRFWKELEPVYHDFRRALLADQFAYEGMAYRHAGEAVRQQLLDDPTAVPHHWFLGLGNLSAAEKELIRVLRKAGKADVRFDTDSFYLEGGSPSRAGKPFRMAQKTLDLPLSSFGFPDGPSADLLNRPRAVRALAVANPSVQGRVAGQLVAEALAQHPEDTIAVVLPDETLLLPVLYGLPEEVRVFNVTMGLSFQATPLYSLIDLLFEVQLAASQGAAQGTAHGASPSAADTTLTYHHEAVTKLLGHPLLRRYERWLHQQTAPGAAPDEEPGELLFSHISDRIKATNSVLVPLEKLRIWGRRHPLIEALFAPWADASGAVEALNALHSGLQQALAPEPEAMEGEYLLAFHRLVRQLGRAFGERAEQPSVRAFRLFLYARLRQLRLPFEGHPIAQVQVMGWLETRALDFDHLIILSCNEGQLPVAKKHESLLPHDLLTEFALPTYADREADTAHQFWRLLQRAARVDLLYALPGAEGVRVGEPSRFLLQIEHDLVPASHHRTTWQTEIVRVPTPPRAPEPVLPKTPEVLAALRGALERGLSPSALNAFLRCPMQFYYKRVAGLNPNEEVEEELGANHLGNAIHGVLDRLMRPAVAAQRLLTPEEVSSWSALLDDLLTEVFIDANGDGRPTERLPPPDQGMNHLLRHVARQQLDRYLARLLAEVSEEPLRVLSLEEWHHGTVSVPLEGLEKPLAVRITGRVDRVDELPGGTIRIVDYKTGKVEASGLNLRGKLRPRTSEEALKRLLEEDSADADKVRQLWLYELMHRERDHLDGKKRDVQAVIISLKNLEDGCLAAPLDFLAAAAPENTNVLEASEAAFAQLIQRLLDPTEPIRRTENADHCTRCDFRRVCAR